MSSPANPDMAHYQWADDDNAAHELCLLLGSEDQVSPGFEIPNADLGTAFLLIAKVHNDGDMTASGDFQLQYEKNAAGGFFDVNASSSNVRTIAGQDTDGASSSTERLTVTPETNFSSFFDDVDSLHINNVALGQAFEFYFSVEFRSADNSGGENYEFRLLTGGATMDHDFQMYATIGAGGSPAIFLPFYPGKTNTLLRM